MKDSGTEDSFDFQNRDVRCSGVGHRCNETALQIQKKEGAYLFFPVVSLSFEANPSLKPLDASVGLAHSPSSNAFRLTRPTALRPLSRPLVSGLAGRFVANRRMQRPTFQAKTQFS